MVDMEVLLSNIPGAYAAASLALWSAIAHLKQFCMARQWRYIYPSVLDDLLSTGSQRSALPFQATIDVVTTISGEYSLSWLNKCPPKHYLYTIMVLTFVKIKVHVISSFLIVILASLGVEFYGKISYFFSNDNSCIDKSKWNIYQCCGTNVNVIYTCIGKSSLCTCPKYIPMYRFVHCPQPRMLLMFTKHEN